jgi:hypothetical protein
MPTFLARLAVVVLALVPGVAFAQEGDPPVVPEPPGRSLEVGVSGLAGIGVTADHVSESWEGLDGDAVLWWRVSRLWHVGLGAGLLSWRTRGDAASQLVHADGVVRLMSTNSPLHVYVELGYGLGYSHIGDGIVLSEPLVDEVVTIEGGSGFARHGQLAGGLRVDAGPVLLLADIGFQFATLYHHQDVELFAMRFRAAVAVPF